MIDFTKVEKRVFELKAQFNEGKIDEKTFEDQLMELVDLANDGYYWMFGHESELWYRYDGEQWVPDTPDEVFVSIDDNLIASSRGKTTSRQALPPPSAETDWYTINIGWFITSLVVIGAIGGIVYYSTLL